MRKIHPERHGHGLRLNMAYKAAAARGKVVPSRLNHESGTNPEDRRQIEFDRIGKRPTIPPPHQQPELFEKGRGPASHECFTEKRLYFPRRAINTRPEAPNSSRTDPHRADYEQRTARRRRLYITRERSRGYESPYFANLQVLRGKIERYRDRASEHDTQAVGGAHLPAV
jgi:hypothetical protein